MFVKICGVTTAEDALLAAGLGADAVGMIFASSSRRIASGEARDIVRRLPPEVLPVGVFRDETAQRVADTANSLGLRAVQLHGRETPEETRWLASRVPVVIKAFTATDSALKNHAAYGATRLLIDSVTPGSGQVFDWAVLEEAPIGRPFILAGGLTPDNVADAVATVRPWGVDVATGVEAAPGKKDPAKVRRFIANAREASPTERHDLGADFGLDLSQVTLAADRSPGPADGDHDSAGAPYDWEDDATWR